MTCVEISSTIIVDKTSLACQCEWGWFKPCTAIARINCLKHVPYKHIMYTVPLNVFNITTQTQTHNACLLQFILFAPNIQWSVVFESTLNIFFVSLSVFSMCVYEQWILLFAVFTSKRIAKRYKCRQLGTLFFSIPLKGDVAETSDVASWCSQNKQLNSHNNMMFNILPMCRLPIAL